MDAADATNVETATNVTTAADVVTAEAARATAATTTTTTVQMAADPQETVPGNRQQRGLRGSQRRRGKGPAAKSKSIPTATDADTEEELLQAAMARARAEQLSLSANAADASADGSHASQAAVQREVNRLEFVDMVQTANNYMAINADGEAKAAVVAFGDKLKGQLGGQLAAGGVGGGGASGAALAAATDPVTVDLIKDVTGQVTEATSRRDWYTKWGKHYLPSLAQAHRLQQCNNFKDPGIQAYGGVLFNTLRDEADANFMKLPPPTPSGGAPASSYRARSMPSGGLGVGGASRAAAAAAPPARAPINMSYYNNCNAGCFHGNAIVGLADGSTKPCNTIVKGDCVRTSNTDTKSWARVACVVETKKIGRASCRERV